MVREAVSCIPGNDRDSRRREFPAPGDGLSPFPAKYGDPG